MANIILGNANIAAKRAGKITSLTATGTCQSEGETYDFVQLPFFIYPPQWAFVIKSTGTSDLKAGDSFSYTELINYPTDVDFITVKMADGQQHVEIEAVSIDLKELSDGKNGVVRQFSVFNRLGTTEYMIAKDDAVLPAVYRKVFGPASHTECEQYVKDHAGI